MPLPVLACVLVSCGQPPSPVPALTPSLTAQSLPPDAHAFLQPWADAAPLESDAPFRWTWWEGDVLPEDAASMREVTPFADFAQGSGELENFASALEQVFGPRVTLYRDELPCEGCTAQAYVVAGQLPDGKYGGFRAVTFWDH